MEERRREDLILATHELARNALVHGGGGRVWIGVVTRDGRSGVRVQIEDAGPGIADREAALRPGESSRGTLGLGLSSVPRLVDDFELLPGARTARGGPTGTVARVTLWSR